MPWDSLGILPVQMAAVLLAARAAGRACSQIGQPAVVGEMAAGIVLGPSVLGVWFPAAQAFLFPPGALGPLKLLGQAGVILFMFAVGVNLDLGGLRRRARGALVVSHAGIAVPFLLGVVSCLLLGRFLAPAGVPLGLFALFMGVAMSVTAFPVLARILEERGLAGTPLGNMAIACAAVDDVTAWCLLAAVASLAKAQGLAGATLTLCGVLAFAAAMLFVARPWVRRISGGGASAGWAQARLLGAALAFVLASAWLTEAIGVHAIFGAFLAGAVLSSAPGIREALKRRLESLNGTFLLPLFFVSTGLRTEIGLIEGWEGWALCAAIVGIATAGKLGGVLPAARWAGMSWRESFALGALMNTRGLMELVVLNVGYDLGILPARAFSMMVIMALVTTFMTGPLLSLAVRQDFIFLPFFAENRLGKVGGRE